MTSSNDIRRGFLDYFEKNGHARVQSAPLVPQNDPTLMFVNAGMVPFKNVFTGLESRPCSQATSSQKCVRAGGKHNDLDNVGYTARHHTFSELPSKSIDTGMGLERIAAVLQGTPDNYETDTFRALIEASRSLTGNNAPDTTASHRIIADHLRASGFLIADGVLPANEGRGYVLRRIMRRAMRHAHLLGAKEPLMWRLVPALVAEMGAAYPELLRAQPLIEATLSQEETRFRQTLVTGLKLLDDATAELGDGGTLPGETAFKLYDTYGFPYDLTEDALRIRGLQVDRGGFDAAMADH